MDDYTKQIFHRKLPTLIVTALVLLAGMLANILKV